MRQYILNMETAGASRFISTKQLQHYITSTMTVIFVTDSRPQ